MKFVCVLRVCGALTEVEETMGRAPLVAKRTSIEDEIFEVN